MSIAPFLFLLLSFLLPLQSSESMARPLAVLARRGACARAFVSGGVRGLSTAAAYERDGFVIKRQAVDADLVGEMREHIDWVMAKVSRGRCRSGCRVVGRRGRWGGEVGMGSEGEEGETFRLIGREGERGKDVKEKGREEGKRERERVEGAAVGSAEG